MFSFENRGHFPDFNSLQLKSAHSIDLNYLALCDERARTAQEKTKAQLAEQASVIEHIALKFNQTILVGLIDQDVKNRFFKFVSVKENCHEWTGSLSPQGYGQLSIKNRPYLAHRIACAISKSHFFDFYIVDHLCMNKRCVNPDHLRLVGSSLNATQNSRSNAASNALKTHCKNGHPLSGDNLFLKSANGGAKRHRVCRTCNKAWKAKNLAGKRARQYLEKWKVGK